MTKHIEFSLSALVAAATQRSAAAGGSRPEPPLPPSVAA